MASDMTYTCAALPARRAIMVAQRADDDIVLFIHRERAGQGCARRHSKHRSDDPRRDRARCRLEAAAACLAVNGRCGAVKHVCEAGGEL